MSLIRGIYFSVFCICHLHLCQKLLHLRSLIGKETFFLNKSEGEKPSPRSDTRLLHGKLPHPGSRCTSDIQLPQLKMKKFSLKVWSLTKLDYFCVPLLKRRVHTRKQSVVIRAISHGKVPVSHGTTAHLTESHTAQTKLKLFSIKFGDRLNSITFASRFEKRRYEQTENTMKSW